MSKRVNVKREKLGERIKRVRQERQLGLRELAGKLGISATYLSRIETCQESSPPAEKVIRGLADLLQDDFDELMQLAGRVPEDVENMIIMQLAGRVPEDVENMIMRDPDMPAFLRAASEKNVSGAELMKMLKKEAAK